MKKLKVKKGSTCMACLACVGACSEAFYKVFDPDKACLQIVEKKAVRPIACPQCGKCAEACPEGAITQNPKGVYMINKKKCTGCGKCKKFCPLNNITLKNKKPVWGKNCTHCMACICYCPAEAIEYGRKSVGKPRYCFENLGLEKYDYSNPLK